MIRLRSLEKWYRSPAGGSVLALTIDSLEVAAGERIGLAGPSGCGKTTLLHLLAGIVTPTAGEIWVDDSPIHALSERQRDRFRAASVGIVFQSHHLLPAFSALENVLLAMSFAGSPIPRSERPARARSLLDALGLHDRVDHRPGELSVGQQQRVAVARALANRPSIIVADEPTANVDFESASRVLAALEATCTETAATLIVASHDPQVLGRYQRVVRLNSLAAAA